VTAWEHCALARICWTLFLKVDHEKMRDLQEAVKVLLSAAGIKPHQNATDATSALHFAAQKGQTEIVRHLLNNGFSVNSKTSKNVTCLQIACQKGAPLYC
jgi:ankyrin repeat protein